MRIRDYMSRDVRLVSPEQTLQQAAQAMASVDAGVLPVSENDRLIGMITDRDIVIRGVAEGCDPSAAVREVMSAEVKYCYEDDRIDDVLQNMGDLQVRRLPVVNRDKRLVGIVSLGDLASAAAAGSAAQALSGISRPGGEHSQVH